MVKQSKSGASTASPERRNPLRGGRLDEQTRGEYVADVDKADSWDTSAWTQWTVTGRILPERCEVKFGPIQSQGISAGGRFKLRLESAASLIAAKCIVEKTDASVFEIAEIVRTAAAFPVDYIAFQNRAAYVTVLDLCTNDYTGATFPIPVYEPIFEAQEVGICFDTGSDKSKIAMPWKEASVVEFPTALHDLTQAIEYPRRTFEYCRMAIEVMRRYFDPAKATDHRRRQLAGEEAMCEALKVTRAALISLDSVAARSRHGDLVVAINWEQRKRAMELTWELVARFEAHLQGKPKEQWKLLDVKVGP